LAFVFIWAMFFIIKAGSQAIIGIIFARYIGSVLFSFRYPKHHLPHHPFHTHIHSFNPFFKKTISITDHNIYVKLLAWLAIAGTTAINCVGVKWGALVQKISMAGKIFSFLMVVCVAFYFVVRGGTGTQGGFDIAAANFQVWGYLIVK